MPLPIEISLAVLIGLVPLALGTHWGLLWLLHRITWGRDGFPDELLREGNVAVGIYLAGAHLGSAIVVTAVYSRPI